MIVVTSMFKIGWPPEVEEFFDSLTFLIEAQRAMIRFDCLLETREVEGFELTYAYTNTTAAADELRMTYWKLFTYAALPLICCFLSYFAWRCIHAVNGRLGGKKAGGGASARGKGAGGDDEGSGFYSQFLATLIIMIFLVHP